ECLHQVVISIDHRPIGGAVAECIRAGSTAAMRHAWYHEDTVEVAGIAHRVGHLPVIIETILRRNGGVRPPRVLDHLAAVPLEGPQVRVYRAEDGLQGLPCGVVLLHDVDREVVAAGQTLHQVTTETESEPVLRTRTRR